MRDREGREDQRKQKDQRNQEDQRKQKDQNNKKNQEVRILLAAVRDHCRVLGPGERFCIWVQGCPFSCPGCIAPSMHNLDGGYLMSADQLAEQILSTEGTEGITISGGEPFLQAGELAALLRQVKEKKNLGVIVYTGFYYERLLELSQIHPEIGQFLELIDLLIDGPYEEAHNFDYGMKGSENQRTILLTDRYQDDLYLYNDPESGRKNELYQSDSQSFLAGVPSKKMELQWKRMIRENGKAEKGEK